MSSLNARFASRWTSAHRSMGRELQRSGAAAPSMNSASHAPPTSLRVCEHPRVGQRGAKPRGRARQRRRHSSRGFAMLRVRRVRVRRVRVRRVRVRRMRVRRVRVRRVRVRRVRVRRVR
eukprot:255698-Prorocentrum_minimum.AAC.1